MVIYNYVQKEINCKIVYYGPGMSGKTTNIEKVHEQLPAGKKSELVSLSTDKDRTLFFDYLSLDLGLVGTSEFKLKFRLFTVPGQVYYNATRKLVLDGADGIIFVADSQKHKLDENWNSLKNLEENLKSTGIAIRDIPVIMQYNKQDMPTALSFDDMEESLNRAIFPSYSAIATKGDGIFPCLKKCSELVVELAISQARFCRESRKFKKVIRKEKTQPLKKEPVKKKIPRKSTKPDPVEGHQRFHGRADDYYEFYPDQEKKLKPKGEK